MFLWAWNLSSTGGEDSCCPYLTSMQQWQCNNTDGTRILFLQKVCFKNFYYAKVPLFDKFQRIFSNSLLYCTLILRTPNSFPLPLFLFFPRGKCIPPPPACSRCVRPQLLSLASSRMPCLDKYYAHENPNQATSYCMYTMLYVRYCICTWHGTKRSFPFSLAYTQTPEGIKNDASIVGGGEHTAVPYIWKRERPPIH